MLYLYNGWIVLFANLESTFPTLLHYCPKSPALPNHSLMLNDHPLLFSFKNAICFICMTDRPFLSQTWNPPFIHHSINVPNSQPYPTPHSCSMTIPSCSPSKRQNALSLLWMDCSSHKSGPHLSYTTPQLSQILIPNDQLNHAQGPSPPATPQTPKMIYLYNGWTIPLANLESTYSILPLYCSKSSFLLPLTNSKCFIFSIGFDSEPPNVSLLCVPLGQIL